MDSLAAILRSALENGWRLGLLLSLGGGLLLLADRLDLPDAGVFKEWLGWAGLALIAGSTLLLASALIKIAEGLAWFVRRMRARAYESARAEEQEREVGENLSTLNRDEALALASILRDGRPKIEISIFSDGYSLVRKGLLVMTRDLGNSEICEVHPAISKRRDLILTELDRVLSQS